MHTHTNCIFVKSTTTVVGLGKIHGTYSGCEDPTWLPYPTCCRVC